MSGTLLMYAEAGEGRARRFRIQGLQDGIAWAPRNWVQVTADTGVGDPRGATAGKGEGFLEVMTRTLGEFIVELAQTDLDELYE